MEHRLATLLLLLRVDFTMELEALPPAAEARLSILAEPLAPVPQAL
jgi:hypothetical protein